MASTNITFKVPLSQESLDSVGRILPATILEQNRQHTTVDVESVKDTLDYLLETARAGGLRRTHSAKACDALCGVINACLGSSQPAFRRLLGMQVCQALLVVFVDQDDSARTKITAKGLNTLVKLCADETLEIAARCKKATLLRAVHIIEHDFAARRAKPALLLLSKCLSKSIISPLDILDEMQLGGGSASENGPLERLQQLLAHLVTLVSNSSLSSAAGELIGHLLHRVQGTDFQVGHHRVPAWFIAVQAFSLHIGSLSDLGSFKTHVLPHLKFSSSSDFVATLERLGAYRHIPGLQEFRPNITPHVESIPLLLVILQVGLKQHLVEFDERRRSALQNSTLQINLVSFGRFILSHTSQNVRGAGFALLFDQTQSTTPQFNGEMICLREHLHHLLGSSDPKFRNDILAVTRRVLERSRRMARSSSRNLGVIEEGRTDISNGSLIRWFYDFVFIQLCPTIPYQRRISAIKAANILASVEFDEMNEQVPAVDQGISETRDTFSVTVFSSAFLRLVLDLLADSFEDVRMEAQKFLVTISQCANQAKSFGADSDQWRVEQAPTTLRLFSGSLSLYVNRLNMKMLSSGRADHADGLARGHALDALCAHRSDMTHPCVAERSVGNATTVVTVIMRLVESAERATAAAQQDIVAAVASSPLHGHFTSIRHCVELNKKAVATSTFEVFTAFIRQLLDLSDRCWQVVRPLLCDDAPNELQKDMGDMTEILSYAWRTLKESSLLLLVIATLVEERLRSINGQDDVLIDSMLRTGDASFNQLSELRHRGAFSTVAQTFGEICRIFDKNAGNYEQFQDSLQRWFTRALILVEEKGTTVTRRSAGLPSLLLALVSADKSDKILGLAIDSLTSIASSSAPDRGFAAMDLPQVHAVNCLRAFFTSTSIAERSNRYVVEALTVAVYCLNSEIWAVINCGLMLFRSLAGRLLVSYGSFNHASSNHQESVKSFYSSHPSLLPQFKRILANKSRIPSEVKARETIFPVLEFLSKAPPPQAHWPVFESVILKSIGSPVWYVRAIASTAYAGYVKITSEPLIYLKDLLLDQHTSQTSMHGRLLIAQQVFSAIMQQPAMEAKPDLVHDMHSLASYCLGATIIRRCAVTFAAAIDLMNLLGMKLLTDERWLSSFTMRLDTNIAASSAEHITATTVHLARSTIEKVDDMGEVGSVLVRKSLLLNWLISYAMQDEHLDAKVNPSRIEKSIVSVSDAHAMSSAIECLASDVGKMKHATALRLAEALCFIYQGSKEDDTSDAVLTALAKVLDKHYNAAQHVDITLVNIQWETTAANNTSLSAFESAILISGYCMAARLRRHLFSEEIFVQKLQSWISLMHSTGEDDMDSSLRHAAALSILAFTKVYETDHERIPAIVDVPLAFTIYDILLDDDDDIRCIGAQAAGSFVKNKKPSARYMASPVAPYACQMLAYYLVKEHRLCPALCGEALCRVTGSDFRTFNPSSFVSELRKAMEEDHTLFAVERPNIYRDDMQEARIWSKVLQNCDFTLLPQSTVDRLSVWCFEGLLALQKTVCQRMDGPLGWTSNAETFALGFRLILFAEILLHWGSKSSRVHISGCTIRRKLREVANDGAQHDLHQIWLIEIERVLAESIASKVKLVHRYMLAMAH